MAKPKGKIVPGMIFLLAGLGVMIGGVWTKLHEMHIQNNGVPGVVLVTEKWEEDDSEDGTSYWISYEFAPPGTRLIEGDTTLTREAWRAIKPGSSEIGVVYLPDDPTTHSIEGSWDDFFYVMLGVGAMFALVGGNVARAAFRE